jgi:threonine dehydratase
VSGTLRFDEARAVVARHFPPTRLIRSASLGTAGADVHLKIECDLPTGSFKVRGAVYSLSVNASRHAIAEVIAASTGNHGAAVAYAGRLLGIPATIFLPANPNPIKAGRIRDLGARIVEGGDDLSVAIDAAYGYAARTNAFFLHDAADADVPCGTATIAMEILDERPETGAIYVPMGDTALIRGVAAAAKHLKPAIRIVGVVAENAPAYYESWRTNRVVETADANTIADGLAVRRPLGPNVEAIRALVDDVVTVSEEEMLDAIEWLMTKEGVPAEPSGAAATAAFMKVRLTASAKAAAAKKPDTTYDQKPDTTYDHTADGRGVRLQADRGTSVVLVTGCNVAPSVTALLRDRMRRGPDRSP